MRRPASSFLFAAGVSLSVHGALVMAMIYYAAEAARSDWTADSTTEALAVTEPQVTLPEPLPEFEMGDASGKGYASHEVPDPIEGTAPEADADQAYFSLDPAGTGESGSDAAISQATGTDAARGDDGDAAARPLKAFGVDAELKLPRFAKK